MQPSPWYAKQFVRFLRFQSYPEDIINAQVSVIGVPSYSAKNKRELAEATHMNLSRALWFRTLIFPRPLIVFGSCEHAFPKAHIYEEGMKIAECQAMKANYLSVGPITNSITEMDAWKNGLAREGIFLRSMLIVTCELHSKSEFILSQMIFPGVKTYIWANSHEHEVELDHPTDDQTSWPCWLSCSVQRYLAFKCASKLSPSRQKAFLDFLRKRQHKMGRIKSPLYG